MRTLREIYTQFPHSRENGLNDNEVAQSLQQFGANRLTPLPREPIWKKFLGKFDEAIIKILLAATLLKTIVDLFESNSVVGMIGLGMTIAGYIALSALKLKEWVPSAAFGMALILVIISIIIGHPSYEGLAVMVAIVLATGVAFYSEYKSDREFEILNAQKESIGVKVVRNGLVKEIPLEEVVVGDRVELEMGDEIPADGRIVHATELHIDQSLMTGESKPVRKQTRTEDDTSEGPDQPGCLYRGTQVVDGKADMIVTDVGDFTMLGQIARRLSSGDQEEEEAKEGPETEEKRVQRKLTISKEQTPLQVKLTNLADMISKVGYIAALAIFIALMVRGLIVKEVRFTPTFVGSQEDNGQFVYAKDDNGKMRTDRTAGTLETQGQAIRATISNILGYFVYMVIIIVVAVPEGLPMSVTVSLALAMRKMTRANSLVRQLVACETIGSATVICSDKTGTLTQNKMQVDRIFTDNKTAERGGDWPVPNLTLSKPVDWIAFNSGINSTANLEQREGKTIVLGNSTEGSLLQWIGEAKIDYLSLRNEFPTPYQLHFNGDRKRMTSVVEREGNLISFVKGAPEVVLEYCTHYQKNDGTIHVLVPEVREKIVEQLKDAAGQAMRTLAFAHRQLEHDFPKDEDQIHERLKEVESNLVFDGFVAIRDPLRPDVKEAVNQCREAGIEVKMITGDNIETARAIGREIGLLDSPDSLAMTSKEFNELYEDKVRREELKQLLPRLRILARAKPLDKFNMVKMLQEQHHVVAVTGDGTNDAPALKTADVGLAMGIAGTEVAKEASKIVLLDDSFSTIVKAVHWGRSLYENIQRFIQFQLTINVSALLIAFLGPFVGVEPPFTVLQLLWINVIMDTFAAIALCSEPPREGLMKMKPKRRDENIVTPAMFKAIMSTAGFFVVIMMVILLGMTFDRWFAEGSGPNPDRWKFDPLNVRQVSMFFTIYVLFQVWNQINCRSLTPEVSGLKGLFHNRSFLIIASLIIIGQIVIISIGGSIFMVEPLSLLDWILIGIGTASVLLFAEIARRIRRSNSTPDVK